mgnify:CR=1 FL=1
MQNCLVEKLNGVVDYNDFPKVGHLRIKVASTEAATEDNSYIRVAYNETAAKAEIVGDGYFMRTFGTPKTATQTASLFGEVYEMRDVYVSDGAFNIEYSDKYDMRVLQVKAGRRFSFDIGDLTYCKKLRYLEAPSNNVYGDISSLAMMPDLINVVLSYPTDRNITGNTKVFKENTFSSLVMLNLENSIVTGDISDFVNCLNLKTLDLYAARVGGDISSIGSLTKLTNLDFSSRMTGTIEAFVQAQRAAGRTTCSGITSLYLYANNNITFDGKPLLTTVGTEYQSTISWTETTITVKDTTITA